MDSDGLPIVGAGVDYSKVDPLHQKRTLTFLNHFLIRTTSFLNHFSTVCDEKLENLLIRIQRLEASMCVLETKLASIPGLEDITVNDKTPDEQDDPMARHIEETAKDPNSSSSLPENTQPPTVTEPPKNTVAQDPRFSKYFKMINMGVPVGAVQLKMKAEGIDPELLNNPDEEAPCGAPEPQEASSGSEFSD